MNNLPHCIQKKERYAIRAGIEGTISQGVTIHLQAPTTGTFNQLYRFQHTLSNVWVNRTITIDDT